MNENTMFCPKCKASEFYSLSDGRLKCKKCTHRFSPQKLLHVKRILYAFSKGLSTQKSVTFTQLSKPTILKYFSLFRQLLTLHSQKLYHEKSFFVQEYEEYRYKNVSIIGMIIDDSIYTLLLPPQKMPPNRFQKVSYVKKFDSSLQEFWSYLETFMKQYYGVEQQYFSDYLKEAEFRYNTPKKEQLLILTKLWEEYEKKSKIFYM